MLGENRDLDLAFLNEKDRVGGVPLAENLLVFQVFLYRFFRPDLAKKSLGIKDVLWNLNLRRVGHGVGPLSGREPQHSTLSHHKSPEGVAMRQYKPVVSGKRLKSGPRNSHQRDPAFPQGNRPARGEQEAISLQNPYVGGLNSPASQPSMSEVMSEVMGSRDTAIVSK